MIKKNNKKQLSVKSIFWSALYIALIFPKFILADGAIEATLDNPLGGGTPDIQSFISKILGIIADIGLPIAVLFIIYSGFLFVKAQGKPEEINKARSAFLWAVIGALVLLGAQAIGDAIGGTINKLQ